jgi:hypothetical protein
MQAKDLIGATFNTVKTGLTGISGAATTYSTGSTSLQYAVRGKAATKAQVSGGTTPTTDAVTGAAITLTANQARAVVWMLNSAGTVFVQAGPVVDLDSAGNYIGGKPPAMPWVDLATYCPIAYTLHKASSSLSGTFTFGSSNWNTTGMTHTVVDLLTLPDRPQTS